MSRKKKKKKTLCEKSEKKKNAIYQGDFFLNGFLLVGDRVRVFPFCDAVSFFRGRSGRVVEALEGCTVVLVEVDGFPGSRLAVTPEMTVLMAEGGVCDGGSR